MDVSDLAPALLALGDLIKQANFAVNRDAAKVNLVVQSDFHHACFQVSLELIQSIYSSLASLLDDDNVKSAKELAEWLGLISGGGAYAISLFKYLAHRDGREIERVTPVEKQTVTVDQDMTIKRVEEQGTVEIKFKGDNNVIHVNNVVYSLGENPAVRRDAAKVVSPLRREGIDEMRFDEGPESASTAITKEEAVGIESFLGV